MCYGIKEQIGPRGEAVDISTSVCVYKYIYIHFEYINSNNFTQFFTSIFKYFKCLHNVRKGRFILTNLKKKNGNCKLGINKSNQNTLLIQSKYIHFFV